MQNQAIENSAGKPIFSKKALVRLIVPLIIEQFLLLRGGMADTLMVTTAGEAAVSGVSLVDNINMLLIQIFAALSTGGAVVVSQYLGSGKKDAAQRSAKQLIYTTTVFSTVIMILALVFRRHVLSLVFGNIEPDVMESALVYFLTTAIAYPFMAIYNAGAALFRSVGNSKISMLNSLIVNIVNITVNAVLIYGFNMGALGAGIGTLTSRIVAAGFILVLWQRRSNELRIIKLFKPEFHGRIVKQILSVGIPNGLENGMFQIGRLLVLSLITTFGTNVVAANAIGNSIAGVINVPGQAIGLAMVVVIGQCMGAGNTKQAVDYTKKLMLAVYGRAVRAPVCAHGFARRHFQSYTACGVNRFAGAQIQRRVHGSYLAAFVRFAEFASRLGRCCVSHGDFACFHVCVPRWFKLCFGMRLGA